MRQTVVGVFDRYENARHAAELLQQKGIDAEDIHVTASDEDGVATTTRTEDRGLLEKIKDFFTGVDDDFQVSAYSEAVRRGGAVVTVDVEDEPQVDTARETLENAGAVDIDERVNEWKASGWSPDTDTTTTRSTPDQKAAAGADAMRQQEGEQVIPVVKEDVQIGKRAVKAGAVRVYARAVEEKVHETLELREERARVERRPANRPATEADLQAMGERTVEVEENVERPVVQKTARVVEEVVVGKDVRQKTAEIDDTVRRTEVNVENVGTDERGRAYEQFDPDYRSHFSANLANSGRRYDDFEPAYRYGYSLASNPRYAGRNWDEFEADARTEWERDHPGSMWDDIKTAARHAWERVKT